MTQPTVDIEIKLFDSESPQAHTLQQMTLDLAEKINEHLQQMMDRERARIRNEVRDELAQIDNDELYKLIKADYDAELLRNNNDNATLYNAMCEEYDERLQECDIEIIQLKENITVLENEIATTHENYKAEIDEINSAHESVVNTYEQQFSQYREVSTDTITWHERRGEAMQREIEALKLLNAELQDSQNRLLAEVHALSEKLSQFSSIEELMEEHNSLCKSYENINEQRAADRLHYETDLALRDSQIADLQNQIKSINSTHMPTLTDRELENLRQEIAEKDRLLSDKDCESNDRLRQMLALIEQHVPAIDSETAYIKHANERNLKGYAFIPLEAINRAPTGYDFDTVDSGIWRFDQKEVATATLEWYRQNPPKGSTTDYKAMTVEQMGDRYHSVRDQADRRRQQELENARTLAENAARSARRDSALDTPSYKPPGA